MYDIEIRSECLRRPPFLSPNKKGGKEVGPREALRISGSLPKPPSPGNPSRPPGIVTDINSWEKYSLLPYNLISISAVPEGGGGFLRGRFCS